MRELKRLQELVKTMHTLCGAYEDIQVLIEMGYEEEDASVIDETKEELRQFEEKDTILCMREC